MVSVTMLPWSRGAFNVASIGAAQFKAKCLGLLDDVRAHGTHYTITKNGEPYARLVPLQKEENTENPLDFLYIGGGKIVGDIVSPTVPLEDYEACR